MPLRLYQVDAFTDRLFAGNPAAVVPLNQWLPEPLMQAIAAENNLSETAFFVPSADGSYAIRWFSPLAEIDFCGHATLASAFVLFRQMPESEVLSFTAPAVGRLQVWRKADGLIEMRFPLLAPEPVDEVPLALLEGLSIRPDEVWRNRQAWFAVYHDEQAVHDVVPEPTALARLAPRDTVVTAAGREFDCVSRYFWPANGGLEDPVTGSIHAGLAPFWAGRLGRPQLTALQASARRGVLHCQVGEDYVLVAGQARLYLEGSIWLPD